MTAQTEDRVLNHQWHQLRALGIARGLLIALPNLPPLYIAVGASGLKVQVPERAGDVTSRLTVVNRIAAHLGLPPAERRDLGDGAHLWQSDRPEVAVYTVVKAGTEVPA